MKSLILVLVFAAGASCAAQNRVPVSSIPPGAAYRILAAPVASDSTVSVTGNVSNTQGNPVVGAQVSARFEDGERLVVGTDSLGGFVMRIPPGLYFFNVAKMFHRQLFVGGIHLAADEALELEYVIDPLEIWSHGKPPGGGKN